MALILTNEERETCLNMMADDRSTWHCFSEDPVMQRKLEKIGAVLIRETANGSGKFYTLRANQVSFRKGAKIEISQERRDQAAARLRSMRSERQKLSQDSVSETQNAE